MLVIVGNPPYNGKSKNNYDIDEYKQIDGEKINEKNIRNLNDDYVKFIRFAQRKMDNVEQGIVGIVVNNGFLNNITFRGMRHSLMKTFDEIYIVNLHGNAKKNETAPNGGKDENIFNIMLGNCIVIFVKNKKKNVKNGATFKKSQTESALYKKSIFYKDVWGTKSKKYEWLENNVFEDVDFIELEAFKPNEFFVPFNNNQAYRVFYEISQIFEESNSGIQTSKDKLLIGTDKKELLKQTQDFAILTEEEAREKYKLGKDTVYWKVNLALNDLKKYGVKEEFFRKIMYRPFDMRYIYYRDGIKKGMIAAPRYNIMQHILKKGNIGFNFQRILVSGSKFPLVSRYISESSSVNGFSSGLTRISPLYLYKETLGELEKIENFDPAFRKFIDEKYHHHYSPEEILGYIYGVMYSRFYQTKYEHYLRSDFARIPFTKSKNHFEAMSELGWELIEMHLMKTIPNEDGGEYKSEGNDVITKVFFENNRVYINHNSYFDNVPEEIWNFDIGSYRVIPHYLKARENRVLAPDEIDHLENVIKILQATVTQIKRIDDVYKKIEDEF